MTGHYELAAHNGSSSRYESPTVISMDLISLRLKHWQKQEADTDFCQEMTLLSGLVGTRAGRTRTHLQRLRPQESV
jgi:hypothetical protein